MQLVSEEERIGVNRDSHPYSHRITPSPITVSAPSDGSTLSFAATDQHHLDREEAMNRLGDVPKKDRKNKLLDLLLITIQTILPSLFTGGINFVIAWGMYKDQAQISWWYFPCPLSGDLAVTIFIQGTLTYFFTTITLTLDYYAQRRVPWHALHIPKQLIERIPLPAVILLPHIPIPAGTRKDEKLGSVGLIKRFVTSPKSILFTVLSGLLNSAIIFFVVFPVSIAIMAPLIGGRENVAHTWWPEALKGVFGFLLNMVQAPIVSLYAVSMLCDKQVDKRRSLITSYASNTPIIESEK
ncbi:hypothetical protein E3P81_00092 [Wallemia ichthyophaga]|uniref:Uncharacterized protein n=1 Tax=Wallemia ichthyophaga (strain EXF-994 / CBS 113033) TaxID=1299270 RepID=R9APM1_WALI9|nr:uncharacterized protein J056_002211 [Wallemia ichthyophaga EXF-994]TIA94500.1 hypothetical protein E3P97_00076 [Wallemia ichthyophaga]EOR04133.1 hypothetical protein J056_002211 [Wallemia ichthyophaga EXF-994]TIB36316.1 hypothetical protein E3P85_00093 [Wallemia ichthyophaga]TIB37692.1 hypothetical protein E3P84_00077 [Wallemia ichthyophaga]TIB44627.1 hypothetical protein E3P83_00077 [Wallemia ichthyophaga]